MKHFGTRLPFWLRVHAYVFFLDIKIIQMLSLQIAQSTGTTRLQTDRMGFAVLVQSIDLSPAESWTPLWEPLRGAGAALLESETVQREITPGSFIVNIDKHKLKFLILKERRNIDNRNIPMKSCGAVRKTNCKVSCPKKFIRRSNQCAPCHFRGCFRIKNIVLVFFPVLS